MKGIYTELKDKETQFLLDIKPDFIWTGTNDGQRLKQLHNEGIKIFRSVGVFCAQDEVEKQENRAINKSGFAVKPYQSWYVGLCPTDEEILVKRINEVETAFNSPYVDGVWLDSIRYPTYWETPAPEYLDTCYCKRCLSMYRKSNASWNDFRIEQISNFVTKVLELKKDKILGYFAVPETHEKLEKIFAQPLEIFENYFDYASPMIYPQMVHKNSLWAQRTVNKFLKVFGHDRVIPILQLAKMPDDSKDIFSEDDLKKILTTLSFSSSIGYFMLGQIINDKSKKEMLKQFFA